jgi:hypothetical protein
MALISSGVYSTEALIGDPGSKGPAVPFRAARWYARQGYLASGF